MLFCVTVAGQRLATGTDRGDADLVRRRNLRTDWPDRVVEYRDVNEIGKQDDKEGDAAPLEQHTAQFGTAGRRLLGTTDRGSFAVESTSLS